MGLPILFRSTSGGGVVELDPAATVGESATSVTLVKVGVVSTGTAGASSVLAVLQKLGVLAGDTAGRSSVAVVLIEINSLSAITAGASTVAGQINKFGALSSAMQGAADVQATIAAIRVLAAIGTAGESEVGVQIGGAHIQLEAATTGSSSMSAEFESNGGSLILPGYARRTKRRRPDWVPAKTYTRPINAATTGSSCVTAQLTLVPPDMFEEELAFVLLEAAA